MCAGKPHAWGGDGGVFSDADSEAWSFGLLGNICIHELQDMSLDMVRQG
jgi:hypothetical protein